MSQVCKTDMGKTCDGNCEDCEDITETKIYEHLDDAIEFCSDDIVNGDDE